MSTNKVPSSLQKSLKPSSFVNLKHSLKKSNTCNYDKQPNPQRVHRKVIKYSMSTLNTSTQHSQHKSRKNHLRSVEISTSSQRIRKPISKTVFKKSVPGNRKQDKKAISTKQNYLSLISNNESISFNPFLSNYNDTPIATSPCTELSRTKVMRVSTASDSSISFNRSQHINMPNHESVFPGSSFHTHQSTYTNLREMKKARSLVQSESNNPNIFRFDSTLIRTLSDPFSGDKQVTSQPSSNVFTDTNTLNLSSPNRESLVQACPFTSSVVNDSKTFNVLSPNNLIIMPLGSISKQTRVNLYSNTNLNRGQSKNVSNAKVHTGRVGLKAVHEKPITKKCMTTSRNGLWGNSLTELLAGLRPVQNEVPRGNQLLEPNVVKSRHFQDKRNRSKLAKSQPKIRSRWPNNCYSSGLKLKTKQPKKSCIQYDQVMKTPQPREYKLCNSFKKDFKENKIYGMNLKNHFKKKTGKGVFLLIYCIFFVYEYTLKIHLNPHRTRLPE